MKVDVLYRTERYTVCRHIRVSFNPRNFTGWGSERVKLTYPRPTEINDVSADLRKLTVAVTKPKL